MMLEARCEQLFSKGCLCSLVRASTGPPWSVADGSASADVAGFLPLREDEQRVERLRHVFGVERVNDIAHLKNIIT